ncbi:hypothetical protein [Kineosporia babensis]|uniref:Uncharacterized protein n=1 Tax=Kineosporia babensis TaxID=499548 RepID=A0A9X1NA13_9ACTN|nr:hypothetical protein [Kineosporia babensis]MCD5309471.1 hypothetical protein [Kineosporia babensis]
MRNIRRLRRAFVATATGALLLSGLGAAASASAAEISGGKLTSGKETTAKIEKGGDTVSYTFVAEKGDHVTFSTKTSEWKGGQDNVGMFLYVPYTANGKTTYVLADFWSVKNGKTALYDFTPTMNGTLKLTVMAIDPKTTGTTTFTYAGDVDKGTLKENTATASETTVPGQNIVHYFKAVAKDKAHISLDITDANLGTNGKAVGYLYTPDGTLADTVAINNAPTFYDFTPTLDGYWKFVVDPTGSAVGKISLTLATDLKMGQLATNKAVTAKIANKGSRANFGVYGEKGEELPIKVSATNWGTGGSAFLFMFSATDKLEGWCWLQNAAKTCSFYPSATGAYKLVLDPELGATGSATIQRTT